MISFAQTERFFTKLSIIVAVIGGLGLIFATLVTCISILLKLLRRALDAGFARFFEEVPWSNIRPILGEEELVTYGVGFALFAALPWVMIERGHIRIDLFESLFGRRFNLFLDFLGDLALTAMAYLIVTRQWFLIFKPARRSQEPMLAELLSGNFAIIGERLRSNQESQILGIPLWPTYVVAEICVIVFFIVAVFCMVRSARAMFAKYPS